MKFLWATDLHLDHDHIGFLSEPLDDGGPDPIRSQNFIEATRDSACDGWLLSGDLTDGPELIASLDRLGTCIDQPIYFVLGNHDFYGDSIAGTRAQVVARVREHQGLVYLTDCGPVQVDEDAFLMGEDGWGDATQGDFNASFVRLNDFTQIHDFSQSDPERWQDRLQELGRESAERLSAKLRLLPNDAKDVIVLTHVPPFCEACWYEGQTTDENWSPFFVCGQMGEVLLAFAQQHPGLSVTVLCGHTHHHGIATIRDNLKVYTGAAQYGQPKIEAVVSVTSKGVTCNHPASSSA